MNKTNDQGVNEREEVKLKIKLQSGNETIIVMVKKGELIRDQINKNIWNIGINGKIINNIKAMIDN